jgi:predicted nucleic acid-binding protein
LTGCTLDTDVVIAALDRADAHHAAATDLLRELTADSTALVICTINYAEALVRPAVDPETLRIAVDAIAALGVTPVSPSAAVARDAARLRGLGISLADGFALATAQSSSMTIASFDSRVRRAAGEADVRLADA